MATVSLIDPYSQQAEEIARRRRMAQALQEQGSQVLEMPTMPGVAISPYAGLAKVLQAGLGAYDEKKALEDYGKLQTDYRNKYNTQFGNLAKAISTPAVPGVEGQKAILGQDEILYQPAVMAPKIERGFGGYGQPQEAGQYEVSPAVAGQAAVPDQAAIPAKAGIPAGYISPELLQGIDIPEIKQMAMARYLAQFEPKQIKLGQNESLYEQRGNGPLTPVVKATIKPVTPEWKETSQEINGVPTKGWINLNAENPAASFSIGGKPDVKTEHWVATTQTINGIDTKGFVNLNAGPAKAQSTFIAAGQPDKANAPEWKETIKQIDGKPVNGWINLNASDPEASFKAGGKPKENAPHWEATTQMVDGKPVAGWINVNAGPKALETFVAGGKPKENVPHWVEGQKDVNGTTQYGWYDLNAADQDASFKAGANPPAGEKSNWREVTRNGLVYYEDFTILDTAERQSKAIRKEAVKEVRTPTHFSEVEKDGNIVIVDMNLPYDQRMANAQFKAPVRNNVEKVETRDDNNKPVTRYVDKSLLATMGDVPPQYKGFLGDLAEAGQLPKNWQSIPEISGLVRQNLINKAGAITQKDLASLKVRIAEASARLGYEGISFNTSGLTPALPNYTTLGGGASSTSAAPKITTAAEIAETAKRSGKTIQQVTRDAIAKGYRVE